MIGRFCEFIKVDENGEYIGAKIGTEAWIEESCKRPAEHIWRFVNHTAYLCQEHYDRLQAWVLENGE